jgi:hypothetical protein
MKTTSRADGASMSTSVCGVPSRWVLIVGIVLTVCVVIFNISGALAVRPRDHRVARIIVAHVAVGVIALGLVPVLPGLISRFARISVHAQSGYIAVAIVTALIGMALPTPWPAVADGLLRREWGIVEPVQFALYSLSAWVCFDHARWLAIARAPGHWTFRVAGWGMGILALEEIDYLGAVNGLLRLTGMLDRGRAGTTYVGSAHDMIALVLVRQWLLPVLLAALPLTLVAVWFALRPRPARVWAALRPELTWTTNWPLVPAGACIAIAQLVDVEARALIAVTGLQRDAILLAEEPMELLAAMLVSSAVLLKVSRDRRRGFGRREAEPGDSDSRLSCPGSS